MAKNSIIINLAERYAAAFGMKAGDRVLHAIIEKDDKNYDVELYGDVDDAFEDVTLDLPGEQLKFSKMLEGAFSNIYAPPIMIDFSREKQLIETEVSGSDNIVVERWGTRPYQVNIRGLLIDVANRNYPEQQIKRLHRLFELNQVIPVSGIQLEDKEIGSIYLKYLDIIPLVGYTDTIQFSLTASAIKEVGFTISKPRDAVSLL